MQFADTSADQTSELAPAAHIILIEVSLIFLFIELYSPPHYLEPASNQFVCSNLICLIAAH